MNETAIRRGMPAPAPGILDPVDLSVGYREWGPPAALRDVLACLWTRVVPSGTGPDGTGPGGPGPGGPGPDGTGPGGTRSGGTGPDGTGPGRAGLGGTGPGGTGPRSSLVLPDGCADLIWERGSGAFVAGPDTGPVPTLLAPGTVFAGVRFRPGAGGGALGLPLSELRDLRVGLADVRRDVARQLPASLEPAAAIRALTAVAGRFAEERPPDAALLRACRLLARPGARAEDVAAEVGLSGRQFRRRCEAAVGYGPKMLQRVLRFRRFVSLVDTPGWAAGWAAGQDAGEYAGRLSGEQAGRASLARAAVDSGYADQPHLTRETVRLAGMTPAALVRQRLGVALSSTTE